jgi:hypothetical protein
VSNDDCHRAAKKRGVSMSAEERKVYLNGEFVPERDARISIFDSALMFGDMVFEMTRSFNNKQSLHCTPETGQVP